MKEVGKSIVGLCYSAYGSDYKIVGRITKKLFLSYNTAKNTYEMVSLLRLKQLTLTSEVKNEQPK